jgi:hypothetical protein
MNANPPEYETIVGIRWRSGALADMEVMMKNGITPVWTVQALYYLPAVETG